MQTIGLLGGTFNPIHFGHLRMAQELATAVHLDTIRFIPSANPPHKTTPNVSADHRAEMVRLAIENNPTLRLDIRELKRTGDSYTVDTLTSLREELGKDVSLILIMGSDAFTKFNTWHRWEEIIQLCHIALVERPQNIASKSEPLAKVLNTFLQNHYTENGDDLATAAAGLVTMQRITALDISSTNIRNILHNKGSARYLLPDRVIDYIAQNKLY